MSLAIQLSTTPIMHPVVTSTSRRNTTAAPLETLPSVPSKVKEAMPRARVITRMRLVQGNRSVNTPQQGLAMEVEQAAAIITSPI